MSLRSALAFCLALLAQPGWAQESCANSGAAPSHRLEAALPTSQATIRPSLVLTSLAADATSAKTVVLEGIIVPARAGEEARAAFADTVAGLHNASVQFTASTEAADRHGRSHGTVWLENGDNLGERLLAAGAGLADVSFAPCAARFLAAEAKARAEKRGIWRQSRIWTDLNAAAFDLPDFVLGRGKVASIGRSGRTTYINFGGNFRTDATVRLREAMTAALVAAGQPPESLTGRVIEVRGWANQRDGLDMELDSPLALRLPDGASD